MRHALLAKPQSWTYMYTLACSVCVTDHRGFGTFATISGTMGPEATLMYTSKGVRVEFVICSLFIVFLYCDVTNTRLLPL